MPIHSSRRDSQPDKDLARLPIPDEVAQAHSEKLINVIRDDIRRAGGRISFARYMELALYTPGLGYYSAGSRKFGEQGDFITAPEVSSLFTRTLAQQVAEVLQSLGGGGEVLEVGGGSGVMAADMLAELDRLGSLPSRYAILELSADLRQRQQEKLAKEIPHLLDKVVWFDELPSAGFRGVVVANELLDALPVHCFSIEQDGIKERFVTWENNRFQWVSGECETPGLCEQIREHVESLDVNLSVGYRSEMNLAADAWLSAIAQMLDTGVVLLIDYGFSRHEYYHPQRNTGTLMCHYRHRSHGDPFVYPGLQDITAHVDFTAIAETAASIGLDVKGYTSQAYFLLSNGITELAEQNVNNEKDRLMQAQQIRTLTMPGDMGELFKVMALTKNVDINLRGFSMQDMRHKL